MLRNFIINFKEKYIWKKEVPRSYKNVDELMNSINSKSPFFQETFYTIKYLIRDIVDIPRDIYRKLKRGIQRGYRGWADEDVWCLSSYLSRIISESTIHLKDKKMGTPTEMYDNPEDCSDKAYKKAEEKWDRILKHISKTFKNANDIMNTDLIYVPTSTENWKKEHTKLKKLAKRLNIGTLNYKESLEYEEGFRLFQKYFLNLWD